MAKDIASNLVSYSRSRKVNISRCRRPDGEYCFDYVPITSMCRPDNFRKLEELVSEHEPEAMAYYVYMADEKKKLLSGEYRSDTVSHLAPLSDLSFPGHWKLTAMEREAVKKGNVRAKKFVKKHPEYLWDYEVDTDEYLDEEDYEGFNDYLVKLTLKDIERRPIIDYLEKKSDEGDFTACLMLASLSDETLREDRPFHMSVCRRTEMYEGLARHDPKEEKNVCLGIRYNMIPLDEDIHPGELAEDFMEEMPNGSLASDIQLRTDAHAVDWPSQLSSGNLDACMNAIYESYIRSPRYTEDLDALRALAGNDPRAEAIVGLWESVFVYRNGRAEVRFPIPSPDIIALFPEGIVWYFSDNFYRYLAEVFEVCPSDSDAVRVLAALAHLHIPVWLASWCRGLSSLFDEGDKVRMSCEDDIVKDLRVLAQGGDLDACVLYLALGYLYGDGEWRREAGEFLSALSDEGRYICATSRLPALLTPLLTTPEEKMHLG